MSAYPFSRDEDEERREGEDVHGDRRVQRELRLALGGCLKAWHYVSSGHSQVRFLLAQDFFVNCLGYRMDLL